MIHIFLAAGLGGCCFEEPLSCELEYGDFAVKDKQLSFYFFKFTFESSHDSDMRQLHLTVSIVVQSLK